MFLRNSLAAVTSDYALAGNAIEQRLCVLGRRELCKFVALEVPNSNFDGIGGDLRRWRLSRIRFLGFRTFFRMLG